jgi:SAM-dependent methyltransferase
MMDGSPDEQVLNLTGEYMAKRIVHALLIRREDQVFELGCGVGRLGFFIAPQIRQWSGFDISQNMINYARKRMKDFQNVIFFPLSKTEFQGIPESYFDKGYSHAVLLHLDKEDVFLYLREVYRILKPGGLFYFDIWNLDNDVGWKRWLWEVEAWAQSDQKQRKDVIRNQFSVPQEIQIYTRRAGFSELFCLSESFWIQSIVMKPIGKSTEERVDFLKKELKPKLLKIAAPATLNILYNHHLDMLTGALKPTDFYELLQGMKEDEEEVLLYKKWLKEVWNYRKNDWGDYPGKSS